MNSSVKLLFRGFIRATFLLSLVISCNSKEQEAVITHLQLTDSIASDKFIPKSYVFSSVPYKYENHFYYLDKSVRGIVQVDQNFEYPRIILSEGDDYASIPKIFYFSIAKNYLFAFGNNQCLAFDLNKLELIGNFNFPFNLSQQIIYEPIKQCFLTAAVDESNTMRIFQFDFSISAGFTNIHGIGTIQSDERLHYIEYSGWLVLTEQSIFYVKDWVGEVDEFDRKSLEHLRQFQLPYSGILVDNQSYGADGKYTSNYFQAYSVVQHQSKIYILRELDWESKLVGEKDMENPDFVNKIRNRIHVFDEDFNLISSIKLAKPATSINYINQNLYTLNYEDEILYQYKVN